jgi:diguanylate cyclase (GGDEF)-like protein
MLLLREEIQRERRGIMRSTDEFAVAHKRLLQEALTDALTQLPNRRHGLDFLASEWAFAQSNGLPMACLLMDIDHFKRINDTYGHAAGDAVLRQLADLLKRASRVEDLVFRYGGEEFAAVLPNASARAAAQIADRIRTLVERYTFLWDQKTIPVTLSIGVANLSGTTKGQPGADRRRPMPRSTRPRKRSQPRRGRRLKRPGLLAAAQTGRSAAAAGVMAQVIVDEAGDEVVAVVVARMQRRCSGWPTAAQACCSRSGCNCVRRKPSASP